MNNQGTGYIHEILFAVIFLMIAITFYMGDAQALMPPIMLMLGGGMVVGGMVVREPLIITGGIGLFAVALVYSEVFI